MIHYYILQTAGGIFLPGDEKAANEGTVSAVGPGLPTETGAVIPMNVKVGDKVLLPEYGGMKVEVSQLCLPSSIRSLSVFGRLDNCL